MSIWFERKSGEIIIALYPELISVDEIINKLDENDDWIISHCFIVNKSHLREVNTDENKLFFCVGTINSEYTLIDKTIIGTNNNFYFSNDINLERRYFVAYRNISILSKIDKVVETDVYIGGHRENEYLPLETFEYLIKRFPKTAEINHYAHARIASIIKEFFPSAEKSEQKGVRTKSWTTQALDFVYTPMGYAHQETP